MSNENKIDELIGLNDWQMIDKLDAMGYGIKCETAFTGFEEPPLAALLRLNLEMAIRLHKLEKQSENQARKLDDE